MCEFPYLIVSLLHHTILLFFMKVKIFTFFIFATLFPLSKTMKHKLNANKYISGKGQIEDKKNRNIAAILIWALWKICVSGWNLSRSAFMQEWCT